MLEPLAGPLLRTFGSLEALPPAWREVLEGLSETLGRGEEERARLLRALDRTSTELQELLCELDALRRARHTAESTNLVRGEILATVSRTMRSPADAILGLTALLRTGALLPTQRAYVDAVHGAAEALRGTLNHVSDFSRLESGTLPLEPIPFDLRVMVEDMAAALSAQAQAKGVSLRLAWRPDSPRRVTGDPGRLRQILAALVGDGLTRIDRGEIVLEVARAASKSSSGGVRFVVEDSGPGIPADLLPTLFEPFTRGDLNPSRDAGLGLPIAQQLARLMGGELEVVNLEGSGTRFSVGIPLTAVDEPVARPLTSGPDSPGMGGRAPNRAALLVVEADPDQRASWAAIAEAAGYQATGLGDRDEAVAELLRLAEAGRPAAAVIFSDHDAEDYDTVGRKLLGDERYGHPALIMLPAVGNPGDARRLREAGYRSYLVKPVVPADLREVLEVFRRIPREARHTLFLTRHSLAEARRGADGSDSEVEARLEHLIGANGETPEQ